MDLMIGCNYWASHAGTEMWANWNEAIVDEDLRLLSQYGVRYMRVFPIWRDFQPVAPFYGGSSRIHEYRMENGELPQNPYYIAPEMIDRFITLCNLAEKHGIKLIVGIVTGWMSGRLFIPPALYNRNLFTDADALMFTSKFVRGFVKMTKHHPAIHSWDLGNECNCMAPTASRSVAYNWTAMVSDAIKAEDSTRPVISGMHGLRFDNEWTIADQAELTDVLTTHPYNYWVPHTRIDPSISIRPLLHATAESELYASIGKKPVFVEEIGTMGPEVCSDDSAAVFMRCQLLSAWAHGHLGLLWWCAFDQNELATTPYEWNMIERYLGLLRSDKTPKPAAIEMQRVAKLIASFDFDLPEKEIDAVCILTRDTDQWAIAYMTYILAKQAGVTLGFTYCTDPLPDAKCYLLPSVNGVEVMPKSIYDDLKRRVRDGAILYVSNQTGILTEFNELFGAKIIDSCDNGKTVEFELLGKNARIYTPTERRLLPTTARVILNDTTGNPLYLENRYGMGRTFYLNSPLEASLVGSHAAFTNGMHELYKTFFSSVLAQKPLHCNNPTLGVTYHRQENTTYAVIINYSGETQDAGITSQNSFDIIYGNPHGIPAGDAVIIKVIGEAE